MSNEKEERQKKTTDMNTNVAHVFSWHDNASDSILYNKRSKSVVPTLGGAPL